MSTHAVALMYALVFFGLVTLLWTVVESIAKAADPEQYGHQRPWVESWPTRGDLS